MIIGISLGTATDDFNVLLVALGFHQFFEGLGLGQVLAETSLTKDKNLCVFLSAAFYAMTTPLGVAIGIGIASTPESTVRYVK